MVVVVVLGGGGTRPLEFSAFTDPSLLTASERAVR